MKFGLVLNHFKKFRRRFTSKLVFRILAKKVVRALWLANGKDDSDVRLNAMLLDVWEANANGDIYILIRLLFVKVNRDANKLFLFRWK